MLCYRRDGQKGSDMTIFIDYGTRNDMIRNVRGIAPENDDTSVVIWYTDSEGQNTFLSIHYAEYVRITIL